MQASSRPDLPRPAAPSRLESARSIAPPPPASEGKVLTPNLLRLFGGDHHDLDQAPRVGDLRLDAGASRKILRVGPCRPRFVHQRAVADVGDPDRRREELRLARAAFGE